MRKNNIFIFVLLLVSFASIVFAAYSPTPTSTSINEDSSTLLNITVSNTDENLTSNITQVNFTLPSGLIFTSGTNDTSSSSSTFTNTSTVLSWENSQGLILNQSIQSFLFNVSAQTPGEYNISLALSNSTAIQNSNVTLTVNDTTSPSSVEIISPSAISSNLSQSSIFINVTAQDNYQIDTITVNLYNSTTLVNSTTGSSSPYALNVTSLAEEIYYVNVTVNDSTNNINYSTTKTIVLDTTSPNITSLESPLPNQSITGSTLNFTFNVSDNRYLSSCNLYLNGTLSLNSSSITNGTTNSIYNSSLSAGFYTWNVSCTDSSGNVGVSNVRNFTLTASEVEEETTTTSSSSSSGGGSTFTRGGIPLSEKNLKDGYKTIIRSEIWNANFNLNGQKHTIKTDEITNDYIILTVSSTPKTLKIAPGSIGKVDVDDDGVYDLSIEVVDIANKIASIFIKSIDEVVPEESLESNKQASPSEESSNNNEESLKDKSQEIISEKDSNSNWFVIIAIIIILIVIGAVYYTRSKKNK